VDPIRPINRLDTPLAAVARVGDDHVRRETPEEANERRQREQRERARKQAARAWADAQLQRLQSEHEAAEAAPPDDGNPHVDVRV
jgi:hypothetical protein